MPSFGEEFKRERELRQISLREVSEATKISVRYLAALENNDFTYLPGGVFNRGFVRAFARFIGVDPEAMVNAYLLEEQTQTSIEQEQEDQRFLRSKAALEPLNAVFEAKEAERTSSLAAKLQPILFAALGVLILSGVILLGIRAWRGGDADEVASVAATPSSVESALPAETDPAAGTAEPTGASNPPAVRYDPAPQAITPTESKPVVEPERTEPTRQAATPSPAGDRPARPAPGSQPAAQDEAIRASFYITRATGGRINCDNRQIEVLSGIRPGTRLELRCERFVIVDADDGGAVKMGLAGRPAVVLGRDGEPIRGYRIYRSQLPTPGASGGGT